MCKRDALERANMQCCIACSSRLKRIHLDKSVCYINGTIAVYSTLFLHEDQLCAKAAVYCLRGAKSVEALARLSKKDTNDAHAPSVPQTQSFTLHHSARTDGIRTFPSPLCISEHSAPHAGDLHTLFPKHHRFSLPFSVSSSNLVFWSEVITHQPYSYCRQRQRSKPQSLQFPRSGIRK